ncbi:hypothetical protein HK099_000222 [Clydaea vesicula]|uniref:Uncharacterized protein n=1 Tax=Clydaea vesicula TaxID=447962 RepID=A0AAD5XXL8_9FUNG|nr:hypothetical protein HK099_000222 [Clydaea vesicula]
MSQTRLNSSFSGKSSTKDLNSSFNNLRKQSKVSINFKDLQFKGKGLLRNYEQEEDIPHQNMKLSITFRILTALTAIAVFLTTALNKFVDISWLVTVSFFVTTLTIINFTVYGIALKFRRNSWNFIIIRFILDAILLTICLNLWTITHKNEGPLSALDLNVSGTNETLLDLRDRNIRKKSAMQLAAAGKC